MRINSRSRLYKILLPAVTVLFLAAVYVVSLLQVCGLSDRQALIFRIISNLMHLPVYLVLTVLLFLLSGLIFKKGRWIRLTAAPRLAFGFGLLIEFYQMGVDGRTASVTDILLNTAGIILGVFTVFHLSKPES